MLRGDEWIGPGDEPGRRQPFDRETFDRELFPQEREPREPARPPGPPPPQPPRHRRSRGLLGPIVRTVVAVVLVGAAGVAFFVMNRDQELPPAIETAHYKNPDAGYEFDYPRAWELNDEATTATVLHPSRQALVSFGLGAKGSLQQASDRLVEEIRKNQRDVEVGETTEQKVAGHDALAVNGTAKNRGGEAIRFLAVTVRAANRNYAIVIFAAQDADPEQVIGPAQAMLTSFRPPEDPPA